MLCNAERCTHQAVLAPVVNVPATGMKRGEAIPLQATLTAQARCRTCINHLTVGYLLTPTVKHWLSMTLKPGDPLPNWDGAWLTAVQLDSLHVQELRVAAAEGGHA